MTPEQRVPVATNDAVHGMSPDGPGDAGPAVYVVFEVARELSDGSSMRGAATPQWPWR